MNGPGGVVAVGASVATGALVSQLRADGYDGAITVVDPDPDAPYDRPPLSKAFLNGADPKPEASWWSGECDVVRGGATSLHVDSSRPVLTVTASDGTVSRLESEHLVIATGSEPIRLPGLPEGVTHFRTAQDARGLREALGTARQVLILGAGTIGTELASTISAGGRHVTLVDVADRPLDRFLGGHLASQATRWIEDSGVVLRLQTRVLSVRGVPGRYTVETDNAGPVTVDAVISAIGNRPTTQWLAASGIETVNGVACTDQGRATATTGAELVGVYAIGDVANWAQRNGTRRRREDWTSAQRQGRAVARTIMGLAPCETDEHDYFWSQQFGRRIQVLGTPVRGGDLRTHHETPERRSSFHTVEVGGEPVAWIAINAPRDFALAMRETQRREQPVVSG